MSSILVFLAYSSFLIAGVAFPFVFALGYVWTDAFGPQYVGPGILGGVPVSMIIALASFIGYVVADRRAPPRPGVILILTGLMAIWLTVTMQWAVSPVSGWKKWDWAFSAVIFAGFIPFIFRSRVQIEAMLQVFIMGSAMHLLGVGIKSALTGGGYNMHLTVLPADTGLAESSAMATVAIMLIPVLLSLRRHSLLFPWEKLRSLFYLGFCGLCLTATIGTGARTGLVCMAVLAGLLWLQSRHKILSGLMMVIVGLGLLSIAPDKWFARMSTIDDYKTDGSSLTRIKMWQWSLDFARNYPLGGGMRAYEVSVIHMPPTEYEPEGYVQRGRATHSTWFEMLTELGYPGLIMFIGLIAATYWSLYRVRKRTKGIEDLQWANDLALALMKGMLILMVGASFIGIGFKPWFWLIFATTVSLSECVRRSLAPVRLGPFEQLRAEHGAAAIAPSYGVATSRVTPARNAQSGAFAGRGSR